MAQSLPLGLLRFCIEHSNDPVNMVNNPAPPRDKADYEWLMAALDNLEGDVEKMRKLIKTLQDPNSPLDEKRQALEGIQYFVEDLDVAKDLPKVDGLAPVLTLLSHEDSEIRYWACWVLATSVQNNPTTQEYALKIGALPAVVAVLKTETNHKVLAKQLSALSALFSEHPISQAAFIIEHNGLDILVPWISHPDPASQMRVIWILAKILRDRKNLLPKYPVIEKLVAAYKSSTNDEVKSKTKQALSTLGAEKELAGL